MKDKIAHDFGVCVGGTHLTCTWAKKEKKWVLKAHLGNLYNGVPDYLKYVVFIKILNLIPIKTLSSKLASHVPLMDSKKENHHLLLQSPRASCDHSEL